MPAESGIVRTERRSEPRIPAYFAVEMSSDAKRGRCGVTRNASHQGLLVITPSRFHENDRLELAVHADGIAAKVTGRIVRIDENPPRSPELWRYRLGVELEQPLPVAILQIAEGDPIAHAG
jgi:hypothetical protein